MWICRKCGSHPFSTAKYCAHGCGHTDTLHQVEVKSSKPTPPKTEPVTNQALLPDIATFARRHNLTVIQTGALGAAMKYKGDEFRFFMDMCGYIMPTKGVD